MARAVSSKFHSNTPTLHFSDTHPSSFILHPFPGPSVGAIRTKQISRKSWKLGLTPLCLPGSVSWPCSISAEAVRTGSSHRKRSSAQTSLTHDRIEALLPFAQETSSVDDHTIRGSSRVGIVHGFASNNNTCQRLLRKLFIQKIYSFPALKLVPFWTDPICLPATTFDREFGPRRKLEIDHGTLPEAPSDPTRRFWIGSVGGIRPGERHRFCGSFPSRRI